MPLHPTRPSRERILGYGGPGAGKSSAWLAILKWLADSPDMTMYLFDTDNGWDRYREGFETEPTNIKVIDAWEYSDVFPKIEELRKAAGRDDWLVFDMGHQLEDWSEDAFIAAGQGEDPLDWITAAVTSKEGRGGAYGINWSGRKKYLARIMMNVQRWPGHVLFLTAEQEVKLPNEKTGDARFADDPETLKVFRRVGYRPQGNENVPHLFHSVLRFATDGGSKWYLTTVKERVMEKRPALNGKEVGDFVSSYLMPVAGWSLTDG